MANLTQKNGIFGLQFRYLGKRYHRSLQTKSDTEAKQLKAIVERTLGHLAEGIILLPESANDDDLWQTLRSGGRVTRLTQIRESVRLDIACAEFGNSFTGIEEISERTIKMHLRHFNRILGAHTSIDRIKPANLTAYIKQRESERGLRNGNVQGDTIRKELQSFKQLWEFAEGNGYVIGENPYSKIKLPKRNEKLPFMTWQQIEDQINFGNMTEDDELELWDCLFLRESEISEFLEHVQVKSVQRRYPFIYPAICFCAYTGCRRSEMFRSLRADVDVNGQIRIREKKRNKEKRITFRHVPYHSELRPIIQAYVENHPGGQYLFVKQNGNPLEDRSARDAWRAVTEESKWSRLRGFHVLRHSFASNLAYHGKDDRYIRALMGHESEEMTRRYRHLFPDQTAATLNVLSFSPKPKQ